MCVCVCVCMCVCVRERERERDRQIDRQTDIYLSHLKEINSKYVYTDTKTIQVEMFSSPDTVNQH